jgi:bleomycin hydrolase
MKKLACFHLIVLLLMLSYSGFSQQKYIFTDTKVIPTTSVKNQYRSGTCWSFSTTSFVETELIRMGKGEFDLSEMYPVRYTYHQRAIDYVRYHGHLNFSGGAQSWDLINGIADNGIMPEEAYHGIEYGETNHVHGEMDQALKSFVEAIVMNSNDQLTPVWIKAFDAILDTYLGRVPEKFTYKGKSYTPQSFAQSLDFHPEDYVSITSFTHHPYYKLFIFESPDNWSHERLYNLPLDELLQTITGAVEKGYSVQWSSDISEKGFRNDKGVAIVPLKDWTAMSEEEQRNIGIFITDEKNITPAMRQTGFDNYTTTDDHAMHIIGLATDQNGKCYFKVKNSWGIGNPYQGYFYASEAYVRYKTMSILLNKAAIPDSIAAKLKLK